ncbi:hypothetical protein NDU88_008225 [Pleurodeles waltl]|uniref:Uncharacterized protein n=1 Tax=Pleurodeles waltl TaxID=8319 RepID=A0AAV7PNP3_PLEWA|nr:hypothetical protein NDU88_008225 [Pleurodeles waltl]
MLPLASPCMVSSHALAPPPRLPSRMCRILMAPRNWPSSFGAVGTALPRYRLFRHFRACGLSCKGERPSSQHHPSDHNPVRVAISLWEAFPQDCSMSTALLTSGHRSEFLRQSDPARPGPRVLLCTADSSSGSPSHECVAARSYDLYSHTLPKICLFSSGGPGRNPSLIRSYRPGRRLISSMALALWDRASHISSCCMCFGA